MRSKAQLIRIIIRKKNEPAVLAAGLFLFRDQIFSYITGDHAGSIACEINKREPGSDYYSEQPVCDPETVTKTPQLQEFHSKRENQDYRRKQDPGCLFIWNDRPYARVAQGHNGHIAKIDPYPALPEETYQDLDPKEQH